VLAVSFAFQFGSQLAYADGALDRQISLDIPVHTSLEDALIEWGRKAGMTVMVNTRTAAGYTKATVHGTLTAREALSLLLRDSGLSYMDDGQRIKVISAQGFTRTKLADLRLSMALDESSDAEKSRTLAPYSASGSGDSLGSADNREAIGEGSVSEVVVTAQKREERLQDVPISISVMQGPELDHSSEDITSLLDRVPGVATLVGIQGGATQVIVRGVISGYALFSGSSPVGYYLDSVPFGTVRSSIGPDSNPYDLDRVEVLRGPQGTLYGASSLDGVVRILTHDPNLNDFDLKARVSESTTDGGGGNYRGDMAINIPIIEGKLAARAVVGREDLSGWIDSPVKANVNDEQLTNLRLKIKAQPVDSLTIGLSAWRSSDDNGAPAVADNNERISSVVPEPLHTGYTTYGATVDYDAPSFSLSNKTSYLTYQNTGIWDFGFLVGFPYTLYTSVKSRVFAEEFNATSKAGSEWQWSVGAFYRDARDVTFQTDNFATGDTLGTNFSDYSHSAAIFGEIGKRFLDQKLGWTLGIRQFNDRNATQANSPLPGVDVPLGRMTSTFNSTAPRGVLSWYPSEDLTAYASYSSGFRSGFNQDELVAAAAPTIPAVKPDKLYNYEVGAKGNLFDRKLSFDVSLYYMDWHDVQQTLSIPNPATGGITDLPAPVNGSSASGAGVDFAVSAQPFDALQIGFTVSWNDLKWNHDVYSGGLVEFHKGDRLDYSPETTLGAFMQYGFQLGSSGYYAHFNASANYTSKLLVKYAQGPGYIDGFGNAMVISRASFAIDSPDKHWTVSLYGDNLNNDRGTPLPEPPIAEWSARLRPRTVGMQLDYHLR